VRAAWQLHPEFGVLCLSAELRRRLAGGLFCAVGALVAAGVVAGVYPREEHGDARSAFALAPVQAPQLGRGAPVQVGTEFSNAGVWPQGAAARREGWLCGDGAASILDHTCTFGMPRRMRTVRSLSERPAIAAIPLGRIAGPQPGSANGAAPAEGALGATAQTGPAAEPAVAQPTLPAQSAPKGAHKHARGEGGHQFSRHASEQGRARSAHPFWGTVW
jgi:hypothetical protein